MAHIYFLQTDIMVNTDVPLEDVLARIDPNPKDRARMHWITICGSGDSPAEVIAGIQAAIKQAGAHEDATIEATEGGEIELHWTTWEKETREAADKRIAQARSAVRQAYEWVGTMTKEQIAAADCSVPKRS